MNHKNWAMLDFIFAAIDIAIAESGTCAYPGVFYSLSMLLFGTGLANLVEYLLEGKDG